MDIISVFETEVVGSIPAGPAKEKVMKTKWKKFEPMTNLADEKIKFIIDRGGKMVVETKTYVDVKRMDSIARVDQYGRVEWRPE